ncbi:hypothetical protein M5W62_19245, partial [Paenibacillus larvae]|nr:hypothetical protein [Paenibacillus larvae]
NYFTDSDVSGSSINVPIWNVYFSAFNVYIGIGQALKLSLPFPLLHTVHATFTAHGVPSS